MKEAEGGISKMLDVEEFKEFEVREDIPNVKGR